jgi:hypothetical protein
MSLYFLCTSRTSFVFHFSAGNSMTKTNGHALGFKVNSRSQVFEEHIVCSVNQEILHIVGARRCVHKSLPLCAETDKSSPRPPILFL